MPRKRALCIGCNYPKGSHPLNGCVNDCAENVQLCVRKLGVPANDIMVLADCPCPGVKGAHLPTKENILHSIERLVTGAKAGDMLYFSFSGHGTQVPDRSGEEADGLDEAIVPGDFAEIGRVITDDELAAYLVAPLTEGVLLTCIFDCCHSGTILDLDSAMDSTKGKGDKRKSGKKKYSKREISAEELAEYADVAIPKALPPIMDYVPDELPPVCKERGMGGPAVFCISGCRDDQTSLDMTIGGKPCGALTSTLMKALNERGTDVDYQTVFRTACDNMDEMRQRMPPLKQCPQLSFNDSACPTSVTYCDPGQGGFDPAYPSPSEDVKPHKSKEKKEKKEGKNKKDGKENKEKKPKEKKDKKGKDRDFSVEIDYDSESSLEGDERKAEMGKHLLAAVLGRH